jgi:hypothetical protein
VIILDDGHGVANQAGRPLLATWLRSADRRVSPFETPPCSRASR